MRTLRGFLLIGALALLTAGCVQGGDPAAEDDDDGTISHVRNSTFTGPRVEVFIEIEDGRRATVNSLDDAVGTEPGTTPIPGHQARGWRFLKEHEHGTSIAYALTSWDPSNPDDYMMAGWWAEFPGQRPADLDIREAARYAIVDGPEIDTRFPPALPVEGTATYAGPAGGIYRYLAPDAAIEDIVTEEYEGTIALSADFAGGTLSGCLGCVGDLVTRRAHLDYFLGGEAGPGADIAGYELHLGAATIREDGSFETEDVAVKHPEREIEDSFGLWGGGVSNRPDADGNPRLVAGFTYGIFFGTDGSAGSFVGPFLALSERFRQR